MMKRILVMICVFALCINSFALGAENQQDDEKQFVYCEQFPDAYFEVFTFETNDFHLENGNVAVLSTEFEMANHLENSKNLKNQLEILFSDDSKKLVSCTILQAWYTEKFEIIDGEKVCVESRLLSEAEVMNLDDSATTMSDEVIGEGERNNGMISMSFIVYEEENPEIANLEYELIGTVDMLSTGFPGFGDDYIGFSWGGNFSLLDNQLVTIDSNDSWTVTDVCAKGETNSGYVWAIEEGRVGQNITGAIAAIRLGKNNIANEGTSAYFQYTHTYIGLNPNITIGSGFSLNVGIASSHWNLIVPIDRITY